VVPDGLVAGPTAHGAPYSRWFSPFTPSPAEMSLCVRVNRWIEVKL
jgi:hypothetical protein